MAVTPSGGGPGTGRAPPDAYPLSISPDEFDRLERQGRFFADLTETVLRRAGLAVGMRILDVGCGAGDMSLLAASLIGPQGSVLGIDRSAEAVETARRRAAAVRPTGMRFVAAELDAFATQERFDAVIGRLVLMYQPDPAGTLRRLCGHLRPGGIVAFQEMAMPLARSVPDGPLFRRCGGWIADTFARAGFELDMGGKLFTTFLAAGLPTPQMIVGGRIEGGPQSPVYDYVAGVVRSMLPAIERTGVATASDVGIDSLAERLRAEALANSACIMPPPLIGAWTRTPA
jgi:SAM-dependent methyltransferase